MPRHIAVFLVALATCAAIIHGQDVMDEDADVCITSDTECRCSENASRGTCLRSQGGGKCLLGLCNEGYRCDCFGFEMCSIKSCSQYTANAGTLPSDTTPFGCSMTPDVGRCHTAVGFLETLAGADNAEAAAAKDTDDSTEAEKEATQLVVACETFKSQTNDILKKVELAGARVPEKDREEVQALAEAVEKSLVLASIESQAATRASRECSDATRQARKKRQFARAKQAEIDGKKAEAKKAAEAAGGEEKCVSCAALEAEIKAIRTVRREAAIEAGTWVKKGKDARKEAQKRRDNTKAAASAAEDAARLCIERSERILSRLTQA